MSSEPTRPLPQPTQPWDFEVVIRGTVLAANHIHASKLVENGISAAVGLGRCDVMITVTEKKPEPPVTGQL